LLALAGDITAEPGDRDNLDLLIALDDVALGISSFTPSQFLSNIYASTARTVASTENEYTLHSLRVDDMMELRNSISGVDLDQEAVKLMEYQAAYEASARVLTISNMLLGQIMDVV
jgi:flagellar hook-associated protein 1 FlgK